MYPTRSGVATGTCWVWVGRNWFWGDRCWARDFVEANNSMPQVSVRGVAEAASVGWLLKSVPQEPSDLPIGVDAAEGGGPRTDGEHGDNAAGVACRGPD